MAVSSLLFTLIFLVFFSESNAKESPPVWPKAWSVSAKETWFAFKNETKIPIGVNRAHWYYDYTHSRMRYDHGVGNFDNFCLMNNHEPSACQLLFDTTGALFVNYPTKNFCCQLCTVDAYCSVLKPDWLKEAKFNGTMESADNRTCEVWTEQGSVAQDYWAQDKNKVPCAYFEDLHDGGMHFYHELQFEADSYVLGEPNEEIFIVKDECHTKCNNSFPSY